MNAGKDIAITVRMSGELRKKGSKSVGEVSFIGVPIIEVEIGDGGLSSLLQRRYILDDGRASWLCKFPVGEHDKGQQTRGRSSLNPLYWFEARPSKFGRRQGIEGRTFSVDPQQRSGRIGHPFRIYITLEEPRQRPLMLTAGYKILISGGIWRR